MTPLWALYRKELKSNSRYFFIIFAVQLALLLFQLIVSNPDIVSQKSLDPFHVIPISGILLLGTFLAIPLMMIYSWYREEKDGTSYQILSYPVSSLAIIRNKLLAFLSFGVLWVVAFSISMHNSETIRNLFMFFTYFCHLVLILGFGCLIMGVLQVVRNYRLLAGTGIIIIGSFLYIWTFSKYLTFYSSLFNTEFRDIFQSHRLLRSLFFDVVIYAYPLLVGLACMYVGFYLFDKFREV